MVFILWGVSALAEPSPPLDPKTLQDITQKLDVLYPGQFNLDSAEALEKEYQIFPHWQLLTLRVKNKKHPQIELQHMMLPTDAMIGIFAYNGTSMLYLSNQKENLEKLLFQEKTLGEPRIGAELFAKLFALILIDKNNAQAHIIDGPQYFSHQHLEDQGYRLDESKIKGIQNKFAPAQWKKTGDKTILTFFVRSGWMHMADEIDQIEVSFDPTNGHFDVQNTVLAKGIFKKMPQIMY